VRSVAFILHHRHYRITGLDFAGFITLMQYSSSLPLGGSTKTDCRDEILPREFESLAALNLIRANPFAVNRLFPTEEYPVIALLGGFKLFRLAGRGK
jgi:hypothetical protein